MSSSSSPLFPGDQPASTPQPRGAPRSRRSVPLISLFVLISIVAVCLAFITQAYAAATPQTFQFIMGGTIGGAMLGFTMGWWESPIWRGVLTGIFTGALSGAACGAMLSFPLPSVESGIHLSFIAFITLLVSGLAARWRR